MLDTRSTFFTPTYTGRMIHTMIKYETLGENLILSWVQF